MPQPQRLDEESVAPVVLLRTPVGHATIALGIVRQLALDPVTYTFGQPRVGDQKFTAWFSSHVGQRWFRVVHWNDPVPHLPKQWLLRTAGFGWKGTE